MTDEDSQSAHGTSQKLLALSLPFVHWKIGMME
jgi:hypothetical protein